MKNLYLLILLVIVFFSDASAQPVTKGRVSGHVYTENNIPATNATISLLQAADSSFYKASLPDKDGSFFIENIPAGRYLLSISQVGFERFISGEVLINEANWEIVLPAVSLSTSGRSLDEVKLESKKPFLERKLDRLIVNVENSIVGAGSHVLNVLERAPGVLVNEESGISLRGKQGVIFMFDGKPTPLSGTDLINYLKSIPSSSVEKIEIITNPSAKYDAAGNAGIINIKFKKDLRQGLNGNITLSYGQGFYGKPSGGTNLNFRKKKWNLFANYSASKPKGFTRFYINRRFHDASGATESVFDQTSFIPQPFNTQNMKFGADFFADKKTVIGFVLNGNLSNNERHGFTKSVITHPDGSLDYTTETHNLFDGRNRNGFGNLNFKHTFDTTGREITVDIDAGRYNSKAFQDFSNQYFNSDSDPAGADRLQINQKGQITLQSMKSDYVQPLKGHGRLEAGFKFSRVRTDSDIKFFTIDGTTVTPDAARSNHFIYQENLNAAYSSYSNQFGKTEIQVGLRMEHTITKGNQVTTGEKFSRNYVLLFPSFFVNRTINDNNQLSFSYSRRIDRPSYRQLNPFRIFVDPYTYVVGDPSLRPVLSNSFEINHTFKGKYISTLSYVRSKAVITDIFSQDDATKISYQIPANLEDFEQYNFGVTIPVTFGKWMNSNIIASAYWNKYSSPLQGGQLRNDYTSWDVNSTNTFTIGKKGWSAELSGFYQSRNAWGLFIIKNLAQVSAGIQKTTADKRSTFKLAATDMFSTNHIAVVVKYQNMDFHTDRTWDSRVLTFSFIHRFGRTSIARARQRSSGIEDEKKRAN